MASPPPSRKPGERSDRGPSEPAAARVTVLGIGQMGLVCAGILAGAVGNGLGGGNGGGGGGNTRGAEPAASKAAPRHPSVVIWGHNAEEADQLTQMRCSPRLSEFVLPESVRVTSDLGRAVSGADIIVSAVPVQFVRDVWRKARTAVRPASETSVISVAKGIEIGSLLRPTQIIADCLRDDPDARPRALGVLSGPTIAPELVRCLPATMIAASDTPGFAARVQRLFSTQYLRIYTQDDLLGVELAGAMKNVIAIAAGVLDGLQAGYNAKSALLARGLAEITRLGVAMGASPDTFFGLSGVGDLATTCFSPEGRNRSCGEALGRGVRLDEYLKSIPYVVEGVATTEAVMELARKYKVEMPITHAVYATLYEGMDPLEGIGRLMSREMKAERVG